VVLTSWSGRPGTIAHVGFFFRTSWGGIYGGGAVIALAALLGAVLVGVGVQLWWITLPAVALVVFGRIMFDRRYNGIHRREHTEAGMFSANCLSCQAEVRDARRRELAEQRFQADQAMWQQAHRKTQRP
jgi:hypothetical protein